MDRYREACSERIPFLDKVHAEFVPSPIVSVQVPGCIDAGMEVSAGGARHNFTGPTVVGGANVGDSLAAIKKLVFDGQVLAPETLERALEADFEGYADVKSVLEERAPKYGNDDDYVDEIVKQVIETCADEVEKYTNYRGGRFRPSLTAVTAHIGMGKDVGARRTEGYLEPPLPAAFRRFPAQIDTAQPLLPSLWPSWILPNLARG